MSPEYFSRLKHLFVVYPGGTGGNHISNILSLTQEFNPVGFVGNPTSTILEYYKNLPYRTHMHMGSITAHVFSDAPSAGKLTDEDSDIADKINNTSGRNVIIGHEHHWHHFFDRQKHLRLKRYGWLIMTFPSIKSLAWQRILQFNMWPQPTYNYQLPYKPHPDCLITATSKDSTVLDTDAIFTDDGIHYMREVFLREFGIKVPPVADEIHSIWMDWMKYVCSSEYLHKYGYD